MAAPLFFPRFRAFSQVGAPLAGGKVYAYLATTSSPQDTFTDSTLATPNANPVILDANGEASIWIGSGLYKFVLTDASNVVQWTTDNVSESGVTGAVPTGTFQPVSVFFDAGNTGAALSIDWANGQQQQFTLTAAATITLGNPSLPGWYTLKVLQDGTGGWGITWAGAQYSAARWIGNGSAPVLDPVASSVEFVRLFWDGSKWYQWHQGIAGRKAVYMAKYQRQTSDQVIGAGVTAIVVFNSVDTDTYSELNTATGIFTPQVRGLYMLQATLLVSVASAGSFLPTAVVGGTSTLNQHYIATTGQVFSIPVTLLQLVGAAGTAYVQINNQTTSNLTVKIGSLCQVTRLGDYN